MWEGSLSWEPQANHNLSLIEHILSIYVCLYDDIVGLEQDHYTLINVGKCMIGVGPIR